MNKNDAKKVAEMLDTAKDNKEAINPLLKAVLPDLTAEAMRDAIEFLDEYPGQRPDGDWDSEAFAFLDQTLKAKIVDGGITDEAWCVYHELFARMIDVLLDEQLAVTDEKPRFETQRYHVGFQVANSSPFSEYVSIQVPLGSTDDEAIELLKKASVEGISKLISPLLNNVRRDTYQVKLRCVRLAGQSPNAESDDYVLGTAMEFSLDVPLQPLGATVYEDVLVGYRDRIDAILYQLRPPALTSNLPRQPKDRRANLDVIDTIEMIVEDALDRVKENLKKHIAARSKA